MTGRGPGRPPVGAPLVAALFALLFTAPPAQAQEKLPLPWVVVDAQGALPKLPTDPVLADPRGIAPASLPAWGPGFNLAAHVFPIRGKRMSLGVGGSYQWTRGSTSPEVPEGSDPSLAGPTVTTRFVALSPQVSLNFGHRRGWSYLSGGIGPSTLTISRDDFVAEEGQSVSTYNYGGGGRWFVKPRLAFSLDFRIYHLSALGASEFSAGHPAMNIVVLNLGVSLQ
jgi:hypothetical protein